MSETIFINGRYLSQPLSGVQRYAEEIVRAIDTKVGAGTIGPSCVLLVPHDARDPKLRHIPVQRVGRYSGHVWDQVEYAMAARRGVALCLAMTGPVALRRQVVVIHDAAVQRHPEHFSKAYVAAHGTLDRLLARRTQIATVSEFSRRELADVLPVRAEDIIVAPNGAEHLAIQPDEGVLARLGLSDRGYFLTLGNLTKNKNLAVALRALARLEKGRTKLVVVGRIDPTVFGKAGLPEASDDVLLPGRLDDAEVAGLMQHARALVFPSIYEGFGIPPLEAFVNGCPVLASTAPAVREVCGPAGLYFEPHDDATLAGLMRELLDDADGQKRAALVAKGRERVALYSWGASADVLIGACERLMKAR